MNYNPMPQSGDSSSPDSRDAKINGIWKIVMTAYMLASIGLIVFWMFKDTGLPEYICELQASASGGDTCYVAINLIGSLLIFMIPAWIAKFIVEKITGVKIITRYSK